VRELVVFRDGDITVSTDRLIFYTFGYDHPEDKVISFLKYIPARLASRFDIEWMEYRWNFMGEDMVRPRELFSPENHLKLIGSFKKSFPGYLHYSRMLKRWLIAVPKRLIWRVFDPSQCLIELLKKSERDSLEEKAIQLIGKLSSESEVPLAFFGIHGSISLGMHHEGSDIDVAVYGESNFRRVIDAMKRLEVKGEISLVRETFYDERKLNKGIFSHVRFNVNATRTPSEISDRRLNFEPIAQVEASCKVVNDDEAMFRPAIYKVSECAIESGPSFYADRVLEVCVMIGQFRSLASNGDKMLVRGMLERVRDDNEEWFRIVVGSGLRDEYMRPL